VSSVKIDPAFNGFIGNVPALETLSILIGYARKVGAPVIQGVGLYGPKSTGKTELARRIAQALGIPSLMLSETGLGDVDQLADRMQDRAKESRTPMVILRREGGIPVLRCPPMVVFIDEVHQLTRRVQDALLPLLEASDRMLRGTSVIIDAQAVSFIVATTDEGRLGDAFRSRLRKVPLLAYSTKEVAQILRTRIDMPEATTGTSGIDLKARELGDESLEALATAARAVPRAAIQMLGEVAMAIRLGHCGNSVDAVWQYIQRLVPCDRDGLTAEDWNYLAILGQSGVVGVKSIASQMGTNPSNLESAIEPFLMQSKLIQRTGSGRVLTQRGKDLLDRRR
jgi:Holliday junction resolvasome RuvABC ATP-dependent DNA helicase subunit